MPDTAPLKRTVELENEALGATATGSSNITRAPFAGTVTKVSYTPTADVTGANSPASRTLTLVNKGQDGNGTTVVATLALTAGVNMSDYDEKLLTLSAVAGATTVAEGDILAFTSTAVGGTGLADPGGTAVIEFTRG